MCRSYMPPPSMGAPDAMLELPECRKCRRASPRNLVDCIQDCQFRVPPLNATPPTVLLFVHLQKTGGTSVMAWLGRNGLGTPRGLRRRLTAVYKYGHYRCFTQLFFDLFHYRCIHTRNNECDTFMPQWMPEYDPWSSRVAVELHFDSVTEFYSMMVPRLGELRRRYAALGGRVVTAVVLRDPLEHAFSAYSFKGRRASTFSAWVLQNPGIQTGFLAYTNESADGVVLRTATFPRGKAGFADRIGCRVLHEAKARLASAFDIVGVTACLPAFYLALEDALLLPKDTPDEAARRMSSGTAEPGTLHVMRRTGANKTIAGIWRSRPPSAAPSCARCTSATRRFTARPSASRAPTSAASAARRRRRRPRGRARAAAPSQQRAAGRAARRAEFICARVAMQVAR